VPETKLSYFLIALKENGIDEVVVKGSNVFFKAIGSIEWFFTNTSLLSKDQLFKTLYQNPGLKISCVADRSAELNQLIMLSVFGLGMVKSLDYIQGKETSNGTKAIQATPMIKYFLSQ
jgi:hypothetical protein